MRIIAGKYKSRLIEFPRHIRPTQDKVRQSIFDALAGVVEGARVLDLFAGSGAFGLEALSRKAKSICFIDFDRRCTLAIERNLRKLGVVTIGSSRSYNFTKDVFRGVKMLAKQRQAFDIIFLDPPYHKGLAKKALKTVIDSGILAPRGFVLVEHSRRDDLREGVYGSLRLVKEIKHSDTSVSFFADR